MVYGYGYQFWRNNQIGAAGGALPPNYDQVVQLQGKTYKSDVDDMYYIEDKTDYGNDALIGDNPVIVGDNITDIINTNISATSDSVVVVKGRFTINTTTVIGSFVSGESSRHYFGISTNSTWRSGYGNLSGISGGSVVSDLELHTFIKYQGDLWVMPYNTDTSVDNIISIINTIQPTVSESGIFIQGSGMFYMLGAASGVFSPFNQHYYEIMNYSDGEILFSCNSSEVNGSYTFNTVTKEKLPFLGDLTNIHGTSNLQTPYAHLYGCDMWYRLSDNKWKNTPLQDDGTSCQGQGDTDDDGYVWKYKVDGIGLNDKEGLNGTEILYQPEASTTLPAIEDANFTTRIWYDALGNALPIDVKDITWNHEGANIQFADVSNPPYVSNYIVYDTPQTGQNLEDIKDFVNFNTPSLDFSDEGNSQYITLL